MSTTLTAGDMLLAAILADPDDDGLRLIYADWLEDDGQSERAEFIRAQIGGTLDGLRQIAHAYGGVPSFPYAAHSGGIDGERGRALQGVNPEGKPFLYLFFRRGFVESVRCKLQSWLDHGAAIVRAHPVTRVEVTDMRAVGTEGGWYPLFVMGHGAAEWPNAGRHDSEEALRTAISEHLLAIARRG